MSHTRQQEVPFDVQRAGRDAVDHYLKMVRSGCTPRFAEMCALQMPPGTSGSDRAFMEGRLNGEWLNSLPKPQADRIVAQAKRAGISTAGKVYLSGLADKRGHLDPAAWVDSASDIKRVAEERNYEVHGIVRHKAREVEPPKPKEVSDSILAEHVAEERRKHPTAKQSDLVEKVKDKIVPRWKRKK